jgi:hypothetical protein
MKNITLLVVCSLLVFGVVSAFGQSADIYKVDYFSNANTSGAPDGTVRLDNPGTFTGLNPNVCAAIFVFDTAQEMSECCSCLLTPDGLRTLSVNVDLTSNPLTGVTLNSGVIKVVSTRPIGGVCPLPTRLGPIPAVRSWVTHIQNASFAETETGSQDATLSAAEQISLATQCKAIQTVGSGRGLCTCGTGD